jgi:hypothetical protein
MSCGRCLNCFINSHIGILLYSIQFIRDPTFFFVEIQSLSKSDLRKSSSIIVTRERARTSSDADKKKEVVAEAEDEATKVPEIEVSKDEARSNVKRLLTYTRPLLHWVVLGVTMAMMNGVMMPAFSFIFTEMLKIFYQCEPFACDDDPSQTCFGDYHSQSKCTDDLKMKASFIAGEPRNLQFDSISMSLSVDGLDHSSWFSLFRNIFQVPFVAQLILLILLLLSFLVSKVFSWLSLFGGSFQTLVA